MDVVDYKRPRVIALGAGQTKTRNGASSHSFWTRDLGALPEGSHGCITNLAYVPRMYLCGQSFGLRMLVSSIGLHKLGLATGFNKERRSTQRQT